MEAKMAEFDRQMTVEISEDAAGPVFILSGGASDPLRKLIVEHAATLLDSHGRWQEATNFRASNKWGPLMHGDIASTAPQPFDVPAEPTQAKELVADIVRSGILSVNASPTSDGVEQKPESASSGG
jgi:hypothetical protein